MEVSVLSDSQAHGISFVELFMQAGLIVKSVMISLILASIWSWSIIIEKYILYRKTEKQIRLFETMFWSGKSLEDLYRALSADNRHNHTCASIFLAAMREWKRSRRANARSPDGLQMRITKVMDVTIGKEADRLDRRLSILATIGSAAPFIGLFGTVWGIMVSFQAIAVSKNTNLAVVAPGIAEALMATALGLVAAIPAVIFYNRLLAASERIALKMEGFSDEFIAILSRQLEAAEQK